MIQGIDVEKYRVRINAMYPDDAHAYDQALARTYPVLAGGCLGLARERRVHIALMNMASTAEQMLVHQA